jgi:hypothetical protein
MTRNLSPVFRQPGSHSGCFAGSAHAPQASTLLSRSAAPRSASGGQAAFVDYISPGQMNVLILSKVSTGVWPELNRIALLAMVQRVANIYPACRLAHPGDVAGGSRGAMEIFPCPRGKASGAFLAHRQKFELPRSLMPPA